MILAVTSFLALFAALASSRFRAVSTLGSRMVNWEQPLLRRGPLVVVQSLDAPAMVSRLAARGIIASCRGNGLRVSFHAYNNEADVDAVVAALEAESALLERAAVAKQ